MPSATSWPLIGEFRHVERIAVECHQRRIALAGLEALQIAVFENQKEPLSFFSTVPWSAMMLTRSFGSRRSSMKMPASRPPGWRSRMRIVRFVIELREAAGLQNVGQNVGGDLGVPLLEPAHAVGREIGTR